MACAEHTEQIDSRQTIPRSPQPVEVFGWACDNYAADGPPPVIVNPEADALSLLSWGLGQLEQCNAILDVLSDRGARRSHGACLQPECVAQFSVQAETVLRAGIEKLRASRG